jgi:hypothetical protein
MISAMDGGSIPPISTTKVVVTRCTSRREMQKGPPPRERPFLACAYWREIYFAAPLTDPVVWPFGSVTRHRISRSFSWSQVS